MVFSSDKITSAGTSMYGESSRLLAFNSPMYHLANLAGQLWNVNASFEATQNNSWVSGQQVSHSSCFGIVAWESQFAYYPCIAQALSQLTQLSTCPRNVFFEALDQGAATSFAGILFGLAAVLVAQSAVLKVRKWGISPKIEKRGQRQQQQLRESMDSIQRMSTDSVHTGKASGSGSGAPLGEGAWANEAGLCPFIWWWISGRCSVGLVDPFELAQSCRDPRAVDECAQLCAYISHQLQPLILELTTNSSNEQPLLDKAAEYIVAANNGHDTFTIAALESRFGQGSKTVQAARMHMSSKGLVHPLCAVFVMMAFVTDKHTLFLCDIFVLLFLTLHMCFGAYIERQTLQFSRRITMFGIVATILVWVLLIFGYATAEQDDQISVVTVMRPVMFFAAPCPLSQDLIIFLKCVWEVRSMLAFFFTMVVLTSELAFMLWSNKLDPDTGQVVDDFYSTFVGAYVFLESVDNWVRSTAHCS